MKISLALGPRQPLSRQTAWGCLTTNVAVPGFGSLMAGRVSGYAQALLAFGGLAMTLIFGARFVLWYIANFSRLRAPQPDPFASMAEVWHAVRWALLGIGFFVFGWLWALATGFAIVQQAKQSESKKLPPRLDHS